MSTPIPSSPMANPVVVPREDAIRFLENAFRNIELPPLSLDDVSEIADGLAQFVKAMLSASPSSDETVRSTGLDREARPIDADEQVEAVAMAIASAWNKFGEVPFPLYDKEARELAKAAILALTNTDPAEPASRERELQPEPAEEGDLYLIRKGDVYYRANAQGYTCATENAGRYTLEEAISRTHPNGPNGPRDGLTYERVAPPALALSDELGGEG